MAKALSEEHQVEAWKYVPEVDGRERHGNSQQQAEQPWRPMCLAVPSCKAWRIPQVLGSGFYSKTGQRACPSTEQLSDGFRSQGWLQETSGLWKTALDGDLTLKPVSGNLSVHSI